MDNYTKESNPLPLCMRNSDMHEVYRHWWSFPFKDWLGSQLSPAPWLSVTASSRCPPSAHREELRTWARTTAIRDACSSAERSRGRRHHTLILVYTFHCQCIYTHTPYGGGTPLKTKHWLIVWAGWQSAKKQQCVGIRLQSNPIPYIVRYKIDRYFVQHKIRVCIYLYQTPQ